METVTKKEGLLSKMVFKPTVHNLAKTRKWCILLAALLIVTAAVDYYIGRFTLTVAAEMILSLLLLTFSNKCETFILKLKLEKLLDGKVTE